MGHLENTPGWRAANRAILIVGTAVVAAYAVAVVIYGPGLRAEADEAARQAMTAEHSAICDKLQHHTNSPDRVLCLSLLLQLQQRHEQAFGARTAGLL
jgi:hypothetical protein